MELVIRLKGTLKGTALEIQQLNLLAGSEYFPRPIPCNPDSEITEGFIGDCNTPPNERGEVTVSLLTYAWLEFDFTKVPVPQTFNIVSGYPDTVGRFIK